MKLTALLVVVIFVVLNSASAEVITPNSNISNDCGSKVKTSDVMVLDLESFGGDAGAAQQFISEHAGENILVSKTPELIKTKWRGTRYDRDSAIKRATKEAAKRGCDLLLILSAGTENVGTYYNYSTDDSGRGSGTGKALKKGGAVVLMGDRKK
jgi:hypothetical protein